MNSVVNYSMLSQYKYKSLKSFSKTMNSDSKYEWHKKNLLGELYENYIYELLLSEYEYSTEYKFVLKGPYVTRKKESKPYTGYTYNANKEIYYFSDGETIAEFDALLINDKEIVFFEITRAQTKKSFKDLYYEIKRKTKLLEITFKRPARCTIITPKLIVKSPDDVTVRIEKDPQFDISKIVPKNQYKKIKLEDKSSCISIDKIDYSKINYNIIIKNLYNRYTSTNNLKKYYHEIQQSYFGLIERMYLGKVKNCVYLIKINKSGKLSNIIELEAKNNKLYEHKVTGKEIVRSIKRTYKDIMYLDKYLDRIYDFSDIEHRIMEINKSI